MSHLGNRTAQDILVTVTVFTTKNSATVITFKRGRMHFQTKSSLLEPEFLINHQARVTVIDMAGT